VCVCVCGGACACAVVRAHRVATDLEAKAGFCFGMDYVIAARPAGKK
jgi:hypothetical protein